MSSNLIHKVLIAFETHDATLIKECLNQGLNPNESYSGKPLVYSLINMYLRSIGFKACMQVMLDHGLVFDDALLLAVLLDDADHLKVLIRNDPKLIHTKYSLDCTFTPLYEASLLHICAEYNHVNCAKVLLEHGMDVNINAGLDENGFGGQTPMFHTVNQHDNRCVDMMYFLIHNGADVHISLRGLIWGKGYDWETYIPDVNPISYAMMGLLRQFQRTEADIYHNVDFLMQYKYGINFHSKNVPNKYLL